MPIRQLFKSVRRAHALKSYHNIQSCCIVNSIEVIEASPEKMVGWSD